MRDELLRFERSSFHSEEVLRSRLACGSETTCSAGLPLIAHCFVNGCLFLNLTLRFLVCLRLRSGQWQRSD